MKQSSVNNQLTPVQVKTARAITAVLFIVAVIGPWFPVLNIPRSGLRLAGMLGFWFERGLPVTFLFSVFAVFVMLGVVLGMDILIEMGSRTWQEKQVSFEFGVVFFAMIGLTLWMLTNKIMQSVLVILAPSTLLFYAAMNLVQILLPVQQRWLVVMLIICGICMSAALIWALSGAGGYGSNGWGFWLVWPVFIEAITIEVMDFNSRNAR
jgi:hypothetical protein